MEEIIIDLNQSSNARIFVGQHLIHLREFRMVKVMIAKQLEQVETRFNAQTKYQKEHLHEAITILGSRGSGKTTFLLSLLDDLKDNSKLESLDIIDPTLIEEKGHVFLDILSRIKSLVDAKLDESDVSPNSDKYLKKKYWNDSFHKLAHGLPLLDGVGGHMTEPLWQDAEFIMKNGIQAVTSARNLEKNFHNLIELGLDILGKKIFIIAFDDIDTNFIRGWRVLETIRKYFTSSRIVTLISGDLKLYSKAIRKQQWKNFGKALLINEGEHLKKMNHFNELVTVMESQYMQKVMKPEKRIHLNTLSEKVKNQRNQFSLKVKDRDLGQDLDIKIYYKSLLSEFGIFNSFQAETFISFLLSLPVRNQIQFLLSIRKSKEKGNIGGDEYEYNNNVIDAFLSDLLEKEVNIDLMISTPKLLTVIILQLLLSNKLLEEAYQLQPTTTDGTINGCLTALSFVFTRSSIESPSLIFDYMIKIGYTRTLASALEYEDSKGLTGFTTTPTIDGLLKHCGVFQDKVLTDVVGNMTSYMRAVLNSKSKGENKNSWGGAIILPGLAYVAKGQNFTLKDRIDFVFRDANLAQRVLGFIPLSICQYTTKQKSLLTYSIFNVIATIAELLREEITVSVALLDFAQIRTYTMPEFDKGFGQDVESDVTMDFVSGATEDDDSFLTLEKIVSNWATSFKNEKIIISPYLLGKISMRFFYALKNIENNKEFESLGQMVNDRVIALMNAVLIEEIREYAEVNSKLNINNTNASDLVFTNNLRVAIELKSMNYKFGFSTLILSCPLFTHYLDPEIYAIIKEFVDVPSPSAYLSVYSLLVKVRVSNDQKSGFNSHENSMQEFWNLYSELRDLDYPFSWFRDDDSTRSDILDKNKLIRKNLFNLLGPTKSTSSYLREFRRFLTQNNIVSW